MFRVVVHMVDGSSVSGKAEGVTPEELANFKDVMAEILGSDGSWQVNVESANGSWAVVPKQSVLWVELERTE
jgi:hypothetical protein